MKNKNWTGNSNSIYKTLGASNHTKKEREANDYYATSPIAAELLLKVENFNGMILEPACGEGHLSKVFEEAGYIVYSSDLIDRGYGIQEDFFKKKIWNGDIITNPPYKCFSSDTEIKTKRGWKLYKKLLEDDEVLSVNPYTLKIEWSKIDCVLDKEVDEELINFKHRFMDILVTQNHRMFSYSLYNNKLQLKNGDLFHAKDINSCSYIPKCGYKWKGKNKEYFVLDGCNVSNGQNDIWHKDIKIKIEDWLEFFGIWLADGCCRHTKNSNQNQRYTISIKQRSEGFGEVRRILKKLPFKYSEYKNKQGAINFEIHSKQLWTHLIQFGKSIDKYIPQEIKDLNFNFLTIFLDSYMFGDSHDIYNKNNTVGKSLSSISITLMEDIQEILLKMGYLTHISKQTNNSWKNPLYIIIFNKEKTQGTRLKYAGIPKYKIIKHYKGKVFCLTLKKNGVFLLRRNSYEFFSGNCAQKFIEHSLDIIPDGYKVCMFLKVQFLEGKARKKLFKKYPPKVIYISSSRIMCAKNGEFEKMKEGGGSAVAYAWYVWEKGYVGDTKIRWIN